MKKIKQTLIGALKESGRIIKTNINKSKRVHYKGEIDLLTVTDKQVEKRVTHLVKKSFPTHEVLAEEASEKKDTALCIPAEYKWIIDPLDGTTNFYHSFPHVCTSIAIERNCTVIMGGVYDPLRDELFFAERGKGAFCNKKRLRVSGMTKLNTSLLATGFPYDRRKHADFYLSFLKAFMMHCHGIRRVGAAALDFCYVACGRLDGFWEFKLHPWDVAAGALIVEEAGGQVTDFGGKPFTIYGTETLATNGKIHREMIRVIKQLQKH
ncbi:MAG: inositol monophosphatase family protein [Candidatus Omnitrophota bacterium]